MFVELVRIESLANNSYVVGSEQSGRCVVIDHVMPGKVRSDELRLIGSLTVAVVIRDYIHPHSVTLAGSSVCPEQVPRG